MARSRGTRPREGQADAGQAGNGATLEAPTTTSPVDEEGAYYLDECAFLASVDLLIAEGDHYARVLAENPDHPQANEFFRIVKHHAARKAAREAESDLQ